MSSQDDQRHTFTGNIFIFYSFDVGDEIDLDKVENLKTILTRPLKLAKYFKTYHMPLSIDLPHPHSSSKCIATKLHSFGAISLLYQIPFKDTLENLKGQLAKLDTEFQEQSVTDTHVVFKNIKKHIRHPRFFHLRTSYVMVQVDQQSNVITPEILKKQYGETICSLLRFETETLSEYQKNEILIDARGYFRGDLIIVDTDATFMYDDEYEEVIDLFEFVNLQQLELQYYDMLLDQQLYTVYHMEFIKVPLIAYLPFINSLVRDPVRELGKMKVDISAIIERLESSIKLAGEPYISQMYSLLSEKLELSNWKASMNNKLKIITDIHMIYQHNIERIREDILTTLIIILILIELIVGILKH